jgi:hypothetical protein
VNESITLSEVKVMNQIRKVYPSVTDYFYQALKVLPKAVKAKDLDNYILSIFITQLMTNRNRIENINIYFPKDEHLGIGNSIFTCKD